MVLHFGCNCVAMFAAIDFSSLLFPLCFFLTAFPHCISSIRLQAMPKNGKAPVKKPGKHGKAGGGDCKYCGRKLVNAGTLAIHQKKCGKETAHGGNGGGNGGGGSEPLVAEQVDPMNPLAAVATVEAAQQAFLERAEAHLVGLDAAQAAKRQEHFKRKREELDAAIHSVRMARPGDEEATAEVSARLVANYRAASSEAWSEFPSPPEATAFETHLTEYKAHVVAAAEKKRALGELMDAVAG